MNKKCLKYIEIIQIFNSTYSSIMYIKNITNCIIHFKTMLYITHFKTNSIFAFSPKKKEKNLKFQRKKIPQKKVEFVEKKRRKKKKKNFVEFCRKK